MPDDRNFRTPHRAIGQLPEFVGCGCPPIERWIRGRSPGRSMKALALPAVAGQLPEDNSVTLDKSTAFMQIVGRLRAAIEAAYLSRT